jgi:DtxR family transcriptional regulator, Mn-dependent transcriptional regulator
MKESKEELSESLEMYLKTIYLIEERKKASRVTDIANELGVIKSSVTGALRTLSRKGLLNYAPYDIITLTDEGRGVAQDILARYSGLRDFFVKILGIDHETAEAEACQMEHRISESVFKRLLQFVEYYETSGCEKILWNQDKNYFCSTSEIESGSSPTTSGCAE